MKKLASLFIIAILFVLSGCGLNATKPDIVVKTKTIVITVPEPLLIPCSIVSPPDKQTFIDGDKDKRIELLTDYSINLLGNLKTCNYQINSIKKDQLDKQKLYNKQNE